jgi:hypothetical protein
VIRRRDLGQARNQVPPTLKNREWRDGTVSDPPEQRVADISISIAKPQFQHLPADFVSVGVVAGCSTEKRDAERVASGPRDGEASDRWLEAVVEGVDHGASGLRQERDESSGAGHGGAVSGV